MSRRSRSYWWIPLLLVSACSAPPERERPARAHPNIVLIVADDLGYGHLGAYGQEKIRTPRLDRLAAEGMRFTQFYAGDAFCAPSRSVLMTGLHTGHTPIRNNPGGSLRRSDVTVAQVLSRAGYATGGFGKWGLGVKGDPGQPSRKGFDTFWGHYNHTHAHFHYPYWIWHDDEKVRLPGNADGARGQYVDDVLFEKAGEFIRERGDDERPFFVYLPSILPHLELAAPEDAVAPYRDAFPELSLDDHRRGYLGSDHAYATFAGMVSRLDRNVGRLLDLLEERGIARDTLVLFTSDNGPQSGYWREIEAFFGGAGPFSGAKGSRREGGIRVPLLARWPGRIEAGSASDHVSGFVDVMATLAELAGATPRPGDGISFAPTLTGHPSKQEEHTFLFWGGRETAVRMGRFKALREKQWALYDLDEDPREERNVADLHPEVLARAQFIAFTQTTRAPLPKGGRLGRIGDYIEGDRIREERAR